MSQESLSRRDFVKNIVAGTTVAAVGAIAPVAAFASGSASGSAATSASGSATASASGSASASTSASASASAGASGSAATGFTYADTIAWDAEYDVVVLGIGFAGMAAATEAADAGVSVLLAEKLPDGEAGGNSRVCGQMFLYGNNDVDATKAYLTALMDDRPVPDDLLDVYAEGYAGLKTVLVEKYGMAEADMWDIAENELLAVISPEYPEFEGSDKVHLWATHEGISDSYLYQSMRTRLATNYLDKIDVWFESPASSLIQDPISKAIIGVTIDRGGSTRNVRANNGVVLACGGFENNRDMTQYYMNIVDYACLGSLGNTGDGIRMAQAIGAELWHMDSYAGGFGLAGLSYNVPEDANALGIDQISKGAMNTGATILVGANGNRWCDESGMPRHGKISNNNGQWLNFEYPKGIFAIYDQTQMDAINDAKELNETYAGDVVSCATIDDAAAAIGCDVETLTTTIDDFNSFVANGKDYQFGRDPQYMRAFDGTAYYVLPLKGSLLNTQGGPVRNVDMQVVGLDGNPIPHLYEAGEIGGIHSFMYAGGGNVGECFISGQIAGANAAAEKDALPAYVNATAVESTPAGLGDETDLTAE